MFKNHKTIHFNNFASDRYFRSPVNSRSKKDNTVVIISAFKAHNFIESCIKSVFDQENWEGELLLGIDNCPDTLDVVKSIMSNYPRLSVYNSDLNTGPYMVYNFLLTKIRSDEKFLIFGADDVMDKNMISILSRDDSPKICKHDGILYIRKDVFNIIGNFRPWRCSGDTDSLSRLKRSGIHMIRTPIYFKQNSHPDQLTKASETNFNSPMRQRYWKEIENNMKSRRPVLYKLSESNQMYKIYGNR